LTRALEISSSIPRAEPHAFPELAHQAQQSGPALFQLSQLNNLPFVLEAPLGSVEMNVQQILQLGPGSILQVDRLTGEPLEITVNGTPIARGEVRIHGERYAIRVTEILRAEVTDGRGGGEHEEKIQRAHDGARAAHDGDSKSRVGR